MVPEVVVVLLGFCCDMILMNGKTENPGYRL